MEKISDTPNFVAPEAQREAGEIARAAEQVFGLKDDKDIHQFGMRFLETAKTTPLVDLSEDVWEKLENTDSYDIAPQDWSSVEDHAVNGHPERPRDWRLYKSRYEQHDAIEAPMILKRGNLFHLVSGNTRLMVARALGVMPKVLVVEMNESFS